MTLSAYHLKGNFGKKYLTNGTGHENVSEKRNGLELYHLQNTCVKTNHLPPQEEAWHWLTKQMVQNFGRFGKSGKKVIPRKELLFLSSPRNYRVFHTNGKRSLYLINHRILIKGGMSYTELSLCFAQKSKDYLRILPYIQGFTQDGAKLVNCKHYFVYSKYHHSLVSSCLHEKESTPRVRSYT